MTTTTPTETITSVTETKRSATETRHLKTSPPHNNKRHAEISQEARHETLLQVENGPDTHVGRFNPKQKESWSQQEGPYVFLSHTGKDPGIKDGLVAATYWFLTDVLKVRAFYDNASVVLGDEKSDIMAEVAFECTNALVFISPSFRKLELCVNELNTFSVSTKATTESLKRRKNDNKKFVSCQCYGWLTALLCRSFQIPNAVQELIWNDHDKSLN